jgi:hypothetical protein
VKKTSISLFKINAEDRDRQGRSKETATQVGWNSTSLLARLCCYLPLMYLQTDSK